MDPRPMTKTQMTTRLYELRTKLTQHVDDAMRAMTEDDPQEPTILRELASNVEIAVREAWYEISKRRGHPPYTNKGAST